MVFEMITQKKGFVYIYKDCPESICPFWISQEPVVWPWYHLAASQMRPYCTSLNSHSSVRLVSRQWEHRRLSLCTVWRCIQNDQANRSASSWPCACPFCSSHAGFFGKASHHPGLSDLLQPRFSSLQILAFHKIKISIEREEICECDGHKVHKM